MPKIRVKKIVKRTPLSSFPLQISSRPVAKMLLFITLAVLFSLCSSQQHHMNTHEIAQHVDAAFLKLDVNPKDGQLEFQELSKIFDLRDENNDGSLSLVEFEKHASDTPIRVALFNMFDRDGDHGLGKTEFVNDNLAVMDKNGDKIVSRHEFDDFYTKFVHNTLQHLQHGNHGHVDHGHHGHN